LSTLTQEELDSITVSDPRLERLTHLHKPYSPYSFLKQAWCSALHKGQWTLEITKKQSFEKTGFEDQLKIYMQMKHLGETKHHYTCTARSMKMGHIKASLGIIAQMFGENKNWK
jgi:hypothetical protein